MSFETGPAPQTLRYYRTLALIWSVVLIPVSFPTLLLTSSPLWMIGNYWWVTLIVIFAGAIGGWIWFMVWFARKAFEALQYELQEDAILVSRGVFFRRKSRVPFKKIQDVQTVQGPLQRRYGIHGVSLQTAGQTGQIGSGAALQGIQDPEAVASFIMEKVQAAAE